MTRWLVDCVRRLVVLEWFGLGQAAGWLWLVWGRAERLVDDLDLMAPGPGNPLLWMLVAHAEEPGTVASPVLDWRLMLALS